MYSYQPHTSHGMWAWVQSGVWWLGPDFIMGLGWISLRSARPTALVITVAAHSPSGYGPPISAPRVQHVVSILYEGLDMRKIAECLKEEGVRKWAEEKLNEAKELIKLGPVVFGEDHVSPVARAIIWDLMDTGQVKRFFTEQPNFKLEHGLTMEQALQTLATPKVGEDGSIKYAIEGQTEATMSEDVESRYMAMELINKSGGREEVAITYGDLMQHAVRHGILVYCYDVKVDPVRGEGGFRRPKKLNDEDMLRIRNEHMTMRYLTTDHRSFPGTVLLGGSDHFNHKLSKQKHLLELMGIDKAQYIECN